MAEKKKLEVPELDYDTQIQPGALPVVKPTAQKPEENGIGPTAGAGNAATVWDPGNNQWYNQAQGILSQIQNRDPFTFDLNGNALYQMYKDQYTQHGQKAMRDTMGQAAGLTGGYGSTYAQMAGQEAYNDYLTKLNAVVPEIYAQERAAYDQQGQDLYNRYNLLNNLYSADYNRYLADRDFDYTKEQNDRAFEWQQQQATQSRAWELAMLQLQQGAVPDDATLAAAGIGKEAAERMAAYYASLMLGNPTGGGSGSGGGGGRSYSGGGRDTTYDQYNINDDYAALLQQMTAATQGATANAISNLGAGGGNVGASGNGLDQDTLRDLKYQVNQLVSEGRPGAASALVKNYLKLGLSQAQYDDLVRTYGLTVD